VTYVNDYNLTEVFERRVPVDRLREACMLDSIDSDVELGQVLLNLTRSQHNLAMLCEEENQPILKMFIEYAIHDKVR